MKHHMKNDPGEKDGSSLLASLISPTERSEKSALSPTSPTSSSSASTSLIKRHQSKIVLSIVIIVLLGLSSIMAVTMGRLTLVSTPTSTTSNQHDHTTQQQDMNNDHIDLEKINPVNTISISTVVMTTTTTTTATTTATITIPNPQAPKPTPTIPTMGENNEQPFPCESFYKSPTDPKTITTNPNMKIFDYILLNNELDMLEIRIRTLLPKVDYFIIAESPMTFTGKKRNLTLNSFLEDQAVEWGSIFVNKVKSKIVHVILPELPNAKEGWEREGKYRTGGLLMGLNQLGLTNATGSIDENNFFNSTSYIVNNSINEGSKWNSNSTFSIISTDLDEIPRLSVLDSLQQCHQIPEALVLQLSFYYYSFQFRYKTGFWEDYPRIIRFEPFNQQSDVTIPNAQTYRSAPPSKFPKIIMADVLFKVKSYSHTEHDKPEFFERGKFLNAFREGLDLFDRSDVTFNFVDGNRDMPPWMLENKERFMYMVDRKNEYAGFFDVKREMEEERKLKGEK
ncbi:hypothetical protein HDU76_004102 [Blyttiomyces sp. JEL0837]|nr:hypothetical protein HDU76_004102 [Blyttiomyces sp. JEL0837]